jgi:RNA polymerase sigma-70 factor (ECF subfamily)
MLEASHAADLLGLWPARAERSPFEETAANEFERRLESALAGVSVAYREVLLLIAVEGLRPAEAAKICGISPEALRQRLSRARAQLAERLDESSRSGAALLSELRS